MARDDPKKPPAKKGFQGKHSKKFACNLKTGRDIKNLTTCTCYHKAITTGAVPLPPSQADAIISHIDLKLSAAAGSMTKAALEQTLHSSHVKGIQACKEATATAQKAASLQKKNRALIEVIIVKAKQVSHE